MRLWFVIRAGSNIVILETLETMQANLGSSSANNKFIFTHKKLTLRDLGKFKTNIFIVTIPHPILVTCTELLYFFVIFTLYVHILSNQYDDSFMLGNFILASCQEKQSRE